MTTASRRHLAGAVALAALMAGGLAGPPAHAQGYPPPPPPPPGPVVGPPPGFVGPGYYWHGRHWYHRRWVWDRFHHHHYWRYY